jgi:DNA-binding CsgD family transcriptional regulator
MRRLSDAILSIYKVSKNSTQSEFLTYAFHTIADYVPFGRLRWRAGVIGDTGLSIYTLGSHSLLRKAESGRSDDDGCEDNRSLLLPHIDGLLDDDALEIDEFEHRGKSIAVWYRFAEQGGALFADPQSCFAKLSFLVLSLHRDDGASPFTDNDREIVHTLHNHMSAAWETNASNGLQKFQYARYDRDQAGAIVTSSGTVLFGEELFLRHLADRWPRPVDACLPEPLRLAVVAAKTRHTENTHGYRIMHDGTIAYICAHPRRAADSLTTRELQVAQKVASGLTHKEIARLFGVSPSTVRKQIVSIHERMGVRNNAELAAQLGAGHHP